MRPCPQPRLSPDSYRAGTRLFCPAVHKWRCYPQPLVLHGLTARRPRIMPENVHRGKCRFPALPKAVDSHGISGASMATALANGANDATRPSLWILFRLFCPCRPLRLPERCPGGSRCTLSSCGFPARPLIYPCFSHAQTTPQRGLPGGESVIRSSAMACLRDQARGWPGPKEFVFFFSKCRQMAWGEKILHRLATRRAREAF